MNVKWYIKRSIMFQLVRLEETQTVQRAHCAMKNKQSWTGKNLRAREASEANCEGGSWFLFSVTSFKRRISPRTESQSPKLSRGGGIVVGDEITWVRDLLRRKRVSRWRGVNTQIVFFHTDHCCQLIWVKHGNGSLLLVNCYQLKCAWLYDASPWSKNYSRV